MFKFIDVIKNALQFKNKNEETQSSNLKGCSYCHKSLPSPYIDCEKCGTFHN